MYDRETVVVYFVLLGLAADRFVGQDVDFVMTRRA